MLWICDDCTAGYSVGAPRCPQCGSISYTEQGAHGPELVELPEGAELVGDGTGEALPPADDAPKTKSGRRSR
jgi:hypothetical protein